MKNKKVKINRYEYQWGGQRKHKWKRIAATTLVVTVAAAVGWLGYEPVYNWVVGVGQQRPPAPSQSQEAPVLPDSSSSQVQQPAATPPAEGMALSAIYYLAPDTVQNPTALAEQLSRIKAMGGTGVVFDLKDDKGMVRYQSALPEVEQYLVQNEVTYSLADTIAAIKSAGLTPVGRLVTFKDSKATAATAMVEAGVKYKDSKINWLDNSPAEGGKAWLNPNSAAARGYLLKLVEEAASSGLRTIILDGVQFPTGLSLHLATFGGTPDRSRVLADFLQEASAVVQGHGGKLYPVVVLDSIIGLDAIKYGNSPSLLLEAAGGGIIDLRPEQFGVGVTSESLTLTKPLQTPYESLGLALAAAADILPQDTTTIGAMIQCYTSTLELGTANQVYGKAQVEAQIKAANEAGLTNIMYYNPQGSYNY